MSDIGLAMHVMKSHVHIVLFCKQLHKKSDVIFLDLIKD